jgi:hypothetical protein
MPFRSVTAHVSPPSVLLKTPPPLPAKPVAAYTVSGRAGSTARAFMLFTSSRTRPKVSPPSVLLRSFVEPAYKIDVRAGSMAIAVRLS